VKNHTLAKKQSFICT